MPLTSLRILDLSSNRLTTLKQMSSTFVTLLRSSPTFKVLSIKDNNFIPDHYIGQQKIVSNLTTDHIIKYYSEFYKDESLRGICFKFLTEPLETTRSVHRDHFLRTLQ